ncbi:kinase APK1B, putative [Medicago truncatula]|nr:kinase APK1B, putative [Medicago truncatula]
MIGLISNATSSWALKCFTLKELKTATGNLVPDSQVTEDEFYVKGWIDEHTLGPTKPGSGLTVAVKKLNNASHQEPSEWLRKINNMGKLCHPNLVRLIGYCLEDVYPILVYEYLDKGSFDKCLFKRGSDFQPLSWKMRIKIALDAAKGLAFLHSEKVNVIHGDFNTSNILIDSNHNAKLSDFGLDKYDDPNNYARLNPITYAAPEYSTTGHLTKKSDIYGFGVLLLEIMSGKRAWDYDRPRREHNLVVWSQPLLVNKDKIYQVMDSHIEGQYSPHEAMEVARIAIQCLSFSSKNRPNIDDVVRSLEKL